MYVKVFISASLAALTALTSFGLNISIARVSGIEFFANFSFIISLATIVSVFASLGMNQFLLLRVPVLTLKELNRDISKVFNTLLLVFIPFGVGVAFFLFFKGDDVLTIVSVIGISFSLTLLLMFQSIYISLKKVFLYQIYDKIMRNIIIISSILTFSSFSSFSSFLFFEKFSNFIFFIFCSYVFSLLILYLKLKKVIVFKPKNGLLRVAQVYEFLPLYLVFISVSLIGNLDIIILDFLSNTQSVAVFSASQKIALLAGFIVNAVANVLVPYFVKANHNKDKGSMDKDINVSTNLGFYSILIFLVFCLFFGELLLGFFGDVYTSGYILLLFLVGNSLISAMYGQTLTLMKVKGEGKLLARYILISLSAKLAFIPILFNFYGIVGIAISSIICTIIWNQMSYIYLKRKYGINTFVFKWK